MVPPMVLVAGSTRPSQHIWHLKAEMLVPNSVASSHRAQEQVKYQVSLHQSQLSTTTILQSELT